MSGFFYRLKPVDFHLRSAFGPIKGANVVDWPIDYDELEPYYTMVETEVGISGRVVKHPQAESRSTADFPQPPPLGHPVVERTAAPCAGRGPPPLPTAAPPPAHPAAP